MRHHVSLARHADARRLPRAVERFVAFAQVAPEVDHLGQRAQAVFRTAGQEGRAHGAGRGAEQPAKRERRWCGRIGVGRPQQAGQRLGAALALGLSVSANVTPAHAAKKDKKEKSKKRKREAEESDEEESKKKKSKKEKKDKKKSKKD